MVSWGTLAEGSVLRAGRSRFASFEACNCTLGCLWAGNMCEKDSAASTVVDFECCQAEVVAYLGLRFTNRARQI